MAVFGVPQRARGRCAARGARGRSTSRGAGRTEHLARARLRRHDGESDRCQHRRGGDRRGGREPAAGHRRRGQRGGPPRQAAPVRETLLGALTYALVSDAVEAEPVEPLALKGKTGRVPAFRLVGLTARARPSLSPLVGRDAELERLHACLGEAAAAVPVGSRWSPARRGLASRASCGSSRRASAARRWWCTVAACRTVRGSHLAARRGGASCGRDRRGRSARPCPGQGR